MMSNEYGIFVDVAPSDEEFNLIDDYPDDDRLITKTDDEEDDNDKLQVVDVPAHANDINIKDDAGDDIDNVNIANKQKSDEEKQQQTQSPVEEVLYGEETAIISDVPLLSEITAAGGVGGSNSYYDHHTSIANPKEVEASILSNKTTTKDIIIQIFTTDHNDKNNNYSEVTQEQLDRVKMMHRKMSEGALFTFNYNTLIFVASILAGCGLVSNSVATIIASMLVSPLMGPVIGLAYGTSIRDWKLVKASIKTELLSLAFCIIMGMIIGAMTGKTKLSENWPTPEMAGRGTWENLLIGLPIAFFSGIGVAVSLLDDQTSSLVGVAISASLLPPAVNAGILWVAYGFAKKNENLYSSTESPCTCVVTDLDNNVPQELIGTVSYQTSSEDDDSAYTSHNDFRKAGGISLLLTVANIVLIWISSMFMFRIKENLPVKKKIFWSDLGIARKVYQKKAIIKRYHNDSSTATTPEAISIDSNVESNRPEN